MFINSGSSPRERRPVRGKGKRIILPCLKPTYLIRRKWDVAPLMKALNACISNFLVIGRGKPSNARPETRESCLAHLWGRSPYFFRRIHSERNAWSPHSCCLILKRNKVSLRSSLREGSSHKGIRELIYPYVLLSRLSTCNAWRYSEILLFN